VVPVHDRAAYPGIALGDEEGGGAQAEVGRQVDGCTDDSGRDEQVQLGHPQPAGDENLEDEDHPPGEHRAGQ